MFDYPILSILIWLPIVIGLILVASNDIGKSLSTTITLYFFDNSLAIVDPEKPDPTTQKSIIIEIKTCTFHLLRELHNLQVRQ